MKAGIILAASCLIAGGAHAQSCKQLPTSAPWILVQRQTLSEEDGAWKNDSLRKVLMKAANMTGSSVAPQLGWEAPTTPDSMAIDVVTALRNAPRGSPWPTRSMVGLAGVRAVFMLAHRDTAFARVAMRRLMEAGFDESIRPDLAVLEDRVRMQSGRKQLYGTQLVQVNGKWAPAATEDSAHVDLRREGANLPPLAWSVCNANSK